MLENKTLLVLGAGASRPYYLPTAEELRELASFGRHGPKVWADLLLHNREYEALRLFIDKACDEEKITSTKVAEFRRRLNQSDGITIDTWIKENMDFVDVATISIAAVILTCEREDLNHGDWCKRLVQAIAANATFTADRLKVITFNYDRSFELRLAQTYQGYRNKDFAALSEVIEICHVYGDLGDLYAQKRPVYYGARGNTRYAAKRLQLAIGNEASDVVARCRSWMQWAERVYFLGLSYWSQHLEMLDTKKLLGGKGVYPCGYKISQARWDRIRYKDFGSSFVPHKVIDLDADEFTRQYPF